MLETDPNKRINIKDVRNHPWVKNKNQLFEYIGKNRKN